MSDSQVRHSASCNRRCGRTCFDWDSCLPGSRREVRKKRVRKSPVKVSFLSLCGTCGRPVASPLQKQCLICVRNGANTQETF